MNVHRKAKFSLGKTPFNDPCIDCIVGVVCNKDECVDKIKYEMAQNKDKPETIKIKKKKVKKTKLWRNINGIRN